MEVKDLINQARLRKGLTMREVAERIGVSEGTVSRWESGAIGNMRRDNIVGLSKVLDISPITLMGWDDELKPVDLSASVKIPVVGKIPAGTPVEAIEDVIDYIDIPEDWIKGDAEYIGLEVKGDSMYPVLLDGDTVVIQVQPSAETGDICACYVNGFDATLKRISLTPNSITLKPENPNYPPKTYTHPGEVTIAGKVVEVRRKL